MSGWFKGNAVGGLGDFMYIEVSFLVVSGVCGSCFVFFGSLLGGWFEGGGGGGVAVTTEWF